MVKRRASAAQIAWRKKFAERFGGKKKTRRKAAKVATMARRYRHKAYHRKSGGSGFGLKSVVMAGIGGYLGQMAAGYIPVNVPMKSDLGAALGGYFLGGKKPASAVVGWIAPKVVGGVSGAVGGSSSGF